MDILIIVLSAGAGLTPAFAVWIITKQKNEQ